MEGIRTRQIYVSDDISSAGSSEREERRGIAGVALIVKIAGAAAQAGLSLDEAASLAELANQNLFTASVTTCLLYTSRCV